MKELIFIFKMLKWRLRPRIYSHHDQGAPIRSATQYLDYINYKDTKAQNMQSARLSLQSSKLSPPPRPLIRKRVLPPPPFGSGGGGTHTPGGSQFGRRDRHSMVLYRCSIIRLRTKESLYKILQFLQLSGTFRLDTLPVTSFVTSMAPCSPRKNKA